MCLHGIRRGFAPGNGACLKLSFLPRDEGFFDLFNQMADEIRGAAGLLEQMFAHDPPDASKADLIKDAEHRSDALTPVSYTHLTLPTILRV